MHKPPFCAIAAFALALTSLCTPSAFAQPRGLSSELSAAAPVSVMPANPAKDFTFSDNANKDQPGSFAAVGERNGKPLFRAVNTKGSINPDGVNVRWNTGGPIKKGDILFVRYFARAIEAKQESGEAEGFFFFQKNGSGGGEERDFAQAFSIGPDWTEVTASFVAKGDYAPGEAYASLAFSNLPQTIEFSEFDVLNFGNRLALSALPVTKFTYAGRDAGAAWRKEALKRIEQIRTAPLIIRVTDAKGRPVKGAKVDVTMTQSAFLWGSSVSAERLTDVGPDADRYRKEVINLFDTTVIENGFKWPRWVEPPYRARALRSLDWLIKNGKRVKGHNLAWTAWKFTPKFIADDPAKRADIAALNDAHIREITGVIGNRVVGWDVVNEAIHETEYYKYMPREHVANWFKLAAAADPKAKLTFNEYGLLNRSSSPIMIADILAFVKMLKANGARVDILGAQAHVGQTPRPPIAVLSDLDLLASDGHKIQITEFDFNTRDEALQADYTRDFLIALYSHKAVTGFIQWGFWESEHWKPAAAMFRPDWSEKPNLKVWRDLVLGDWRTRLALTTPADGTVVGRGHFGTYQVTVSYKGRKILKSYTLSKDAKPLTIMTNKVFKQGI
jgi:endo-1,4-beta-xylanase